MAQLVEQRIRNAWVAGSSPAIGSFHAGVRIYVLTPVVLKVNYLLLADLAQLVEHWLPKPRVAGSSPVIRSIFLSPLFTLFSLGFNLYRRKNHEVNTRAFFSFSKTVILLYCHACNAKKSFLETVICYLSRLGMMSLTCPRDTP